MPEHRLLLRDIDIPDIEQMDMYVTHGGYDAAERMLAEMASQDVIDEVERSGLTGRGGAWEAVAPKWRAMPAPTATEPNYLCVNANESEPGTFRDRKLIERNPHQIVEGVLIAAYAIGARTAYIYVRDGMARGMKLLEDAIAAAYERGLLGVDIRASGYDLDIYVHPGGGAHIAGEETALLEALEGKRAQPRARTFWPHRTTLFGQPALVQNVGTLAYLPHIIARGAEWFSSLGTQRHPGTCVFCVSGHVRRPGLYEIEMGAATLRELIEEYAGGVRQGHQLKAVLPGGAASVVLTADQIDVRLCPEEWAVPGGGPLQGNFGTGGVIVMDETTSMVDAALNLMQFYARESCGQCTPCREGAPWLRDVVRRVERGQARMEDIGLLESVAAQVSPLLGEETLALCRFAPSFAWAMQGFLRAFGEEFAQYIEAGGCPFPQDKGIKVPDSVSVRF
jgi:NADH-quinone oxidoreductase subunit F